MIAQATVAVTSTLSPRSSSSLDKEKEKWEKEREKMRRERDEVDAKLMLKVLFLLPHRCVI